MNNTLLEKNTMDSSELSNFDLWEIPCSEKSSNNLLALFDEQVSLEQLKNKLNIFNKDHNIFGISLSENKITSKDLLEKLQSLNIKKITLFAFGNTFEKAAELILAESSLFRRAVFVDPIFVREISLKNRIVGFLEKLIPFGLPVYLNSTSSVVSNDLLRLRCPILFVNSGKSNLEIREKFIKVPNARFYNLKFPFYTETGSINLEALKIVIEFLEQPVKRSQKPEKTKNTSF